MNYFHPETASVVYFFPLKLILRPPDQEDTKGSSWLIHFVDVDPEKSDPDLLAMQNECKKMT